MMKDMKAFGSSPLLYYWKVFKLLGILFDFTQAVRKSIVPTWERTFPVATMLKNALSSMNCPYPRVPFSYRISSRAQLPPSLEYHKSIRPMPADNYDVKLDQMIHSSAICLQLLFDKMSGQLTDCLHSNIDYLK